MGVLTVRALPFGVYTGPFCLEHACLLQHDDEAPGHPNDHLWIVVSPTTIPLGLIGLLANLGRVDMRPFRRASCQAPFTKTMSEVLIVPARGSVSEILRTFLISPCLRP